MGDVVENGVGVWWGLLFLSLCKDRVCCLVTRTEKGQGNHS